MLFASVQKNSGTAKYNLNYTKADGSANYDAAGNLLGYQLVNYDGSAYTNTYTYSHLRRDAYLEASVSGTSSLLQPGTTTNSYDVNNNLVAVTDSTKAANNRSFINDVAGRILQGTQNGNVQRQLVVSGEVLGRYGSYLNPDKPADSSGNPQFVTGSSFNFGYTKISGSYPATQPGTRTVAAGETLQSIARSAYGDATLWYLIADANGLSGDRDLRVGQTLTVPSRVTGANNSSTFKPYNPGAVVGDTTPNLPSPPAGGGGGGGCGGLGVIIMVVVAVAVTVATSGAATAFFGGNAILGGAAAAAMGSIASQVVGNVLGIQNGFDWNAVALAAVSGGVGAGVNAAAQGTALAGSGLGATVARAAISNAMTQGIAVVTGLQKEFNWTGVAASAVGAGVGYGMNKALGLTDAAGKATNAYSGAEKVARAAFSGFAAGTATALARGGRVEITQIAADAFGNALGSEWGEEMVKADAQVKLEARRAEVQANDLLADGQAKIRGMMNYGKGVQYAANGVTDLGLPLVMTDAGGGLSDAVGEFNGFNSEPVVSNVPLTEKHDLSDKANWDKYLNEVNNMRAQGLTLSPQDIATSKALLFSYYGYAMGESSGTSAAVLNGSLDDKMSAGLERALGAYSGLSASDKEGRYSFYSNIQGGASGGRSRTVDITRDGRTVTLNWDKSFSDWAGHVGVSSDEALRKTDYDVYKGVINSAFATDGVNSLNVNGAWRPSYGDYKAVYNNLKNQLPANSPQLATMKAVANGPEWSSSHVSSRGLDINKINDVAINNGGYVNHEPSKAEPTIIANFTNNLRDQSGVKQIFQPWRMLANAGNSNANFSPNLDVKTGANGQFTNIPNSNAILHKNHLHVGF